MLCNLTKLSSEGSALSRNKLTAAGVVAVILAAGLASAASAQSVSTLGDPQPQIQTPLKVAKPMTPQRIAWLKGRCAQLVAFFDYYGVSRGENSDGARNQTRIGASIECERTHYRTGIDTMAVLLVNKAFDVPKPGTPAVEPEDVESPDITDPTRREGWF
ncbi:MAG: hypothetical protein JO339_17295 [Alphaproteobacteria bacterium]|nr:hypothetical protein [Alphaproteobacteria bacterium]